MYQFYGTKSGMENQLSEFGIYLSSVYRPKVLSPSTDATCSCELISHWNILSSLVRANKKKKENTIHTLFKKVKLPLPVSK